MSPPAGDGSAPVDLRSDTVTLPTPKMRDAIARAEVADDVLGGDPTVMRLEETVADLLGKEAALFFPSGIMANQCALLGQAAAGTEVVIEATGHIVEWEDCAAARWAGVQLRTVPTPGGLLSADLVRGAIRPESPYAPRTSLICLENTHNSAGGRILPLPALEAIRAVAREHGLPIHLDGARLWHASVASGVSEAEYAAHADTVMVSLSKGLGCPVGSLLACSAELRESLWRIRRRLGGAMHQAGILAAAGLYALEHNRERLGEDHRRAARLASRAGQLPGVRTATPETNIVMIDLVAEDGDAAEVAGRLEKSGVLLSVFGIRRLRAVLHMGVDDAGVERACEALEYALAA